MASAGGPQPDERAILDHFQGLRSDVDALWSKITELDLERQEHALVLETLVPLEAGRRCFRLVGGVLVERTVGEVAPAVSRNREALEELIGKLAAQLEAKKKELAAFTEKYKIRVRNNDSQAAEPSAAAGGAGVLVQGGGASGSQ